MQDDTVMKKRHSPDPLTLNFNKNELLEEVTSMPDVNLEYLYQFLKLQY